MKDHVVERLNGVGIIMRFVTPVGVGLLMAQVNYAYHQQDLFREEVRTQLSRLTARLDEHIINEVPAIRERITRLEAETAQLRRRE